MPWRRDIGFRTIILALELRHSLHCFDIVFGVVTLSSGCTIGFRVVWYTCSVVAVWSCILLLNLTWFVEMLGQIWFTSFILLVWMVMQSIYLITHLHDSTIPFDLIRCAYCPNGIIDPYWFPHTNPMIGELTIGYSLLQWQPHFYVPFTSLPHNSAGTIDQSICLVGHVIPPHTFTFCNIRWLMFAHFNTFYVVSLVS
jgi:hypothetical protein